MRSCRSSPSASPSLRSCSFRSPAGSGARRGARARRSAHSSRPDTSCRRSASRAPVAAVALAAAGLVLLVAGQPVEIGVGDVIVAGGAIAFAAQIVALSRLSARHDPVALTSTQILIALAAFAALSLALREPVLVPAPEVAVAVVITGVLATSLAFFIQTWAQRHLAATPTAIVLATEPAWATLFGIVLAGDAFSPLRALGALLLLAAPLV